MDSPWGHLKKLCDALGPDSADAELHEARIRAKRVRYAAEVLTPVFGKPARTFARRAETLQQVLGSHQDAVMAIAWLREQAGGATPRVAFTAGRLAGIEATVRDEARRAARRLGRPPSETPEVLGVKTQIRAGGGVVRRRGRLGPEFALVHRPRYDDWTFPKGKAEDGESDEENAEREVREETGFRCERGPEVATIDYLDHLDRPKTVRYWLMYPAGGAFAPNAEVDELRWVDAPTAAALLTYDHDGCWTRALVRSAGLPRAAREGR